MIRDQKPKLGYSNSFPQTWVTLRSHKLYEYEGLYSSCIRGFCEAALKEYM